MELKALLTDEQAVSPVIGVILMVAITVILAAVIGTFVLGLGDQVSNVNPNTSFSFDFDSSATGQACTLEQTTGTAQGELAITHDGGDSIDLGSATLELVDTTSGNRNTWTACGGDSDGNSKVRAGHSANPQVDNDDKISVSWESEGGGSSATLGKWSGPEA